MVYQVQKNVPIPKPRKAAVPHKYPLRSMAVGEMFFVPNLTKNTLVQYVSGVGIELQRTLTTRLIWVPATATTARAVRGVGVWRRA